MVQSHEFDDRIWLADQGPGWPPIGASPNDIGRRILLADKLIDTDVAVVAYEIGQSPRRPT